MGLRETLTLKETLEAATRECAPDDLQCVFMRDWANEVLADRNHEIVALVLDMGDVLMGILHDLDNGDDPGRGQKERARDLLARFDQLGKEQT